MDRQTRETLSWYKHVDTYQNCRIHLVLTWIQSEKNKDMKLITYLNFCLMEDSEEGIFRVCDKCMESLIHPFPLPSCFCCQSLPFLAIFWAVYHLLGEKGDSDLLQGTVTQDWVWQAGWARAVFSAAWEGRIHFGWNNQ